MFQGYAPNKSTTKAGLAVGTTTTLTTANAQEFEIIGKAYKKAATSNEATPTTDFITGAAFVGVQANKGCVFLIGRDVSGNLKAAQGQIVDLDASGSFILGPWFPPPSNDIAPIGYILVKCGSTASTWTFGSSNFAGPPTGVTFTIVDCQEHPARPQIS